MYDPEANEIKQEQYRQVSKSAGPFQESRQ